MTRLIIEDPDVHEASVLVEAVEEFRQHSSARGNLIKALVAEALLPKLEQSINAAFHRERIFGEEARRH